MASVARHPGQSPETITLDGYAASNRTVREMPADGVLPEDTKIRSSNYLNLIEQDHRHIKSRTNVMLGFKRFRSIATTTSGIELTHRIRKGHFDLAKPQGYLFARRMERWSCSLDQAATAAR